MKTLAAVFFILTALCSIAQDKKVTFTRISDSSKTWSTPLPVEAMVLEHGKEKEYYLIIGASDSGLLCKLLVYNINYDSLKRSGHIPYDQRNPDNMLKKEQPEQLDHNIFYKDTVFIRWSSIRRINLPNEVPKVQSRMAIGLYSVSAAFVMISVLDMTSPDSLADSGIFSPAGGAVTLIAGSAGLAGGFIWAYRCHNKIIRTRTWKLSPH